MTKSNELIIVGMSGGVDSSVAALQLQSQGYRVEGLFMKNWEEDDSNTHCSATEDLEHAQQVCDILKIPLHTVNFATEYWDFVFEYFLAEYKAYRTPNPDILCNSEIKFKVFLEYAASLGASAIATGHYVSKKQLGKQYVLNKSTDQNKDQSYFLHALSQEQLKNAVFPLAEIDKPAVRELARKAGLPNYQKKDSTGICFIGERKFKDFLQRYLPAQPGNIVTIDGEVIGKHDGLMYYTLGQRQGLNIGGLKDKADTPWYVAKKNIPNNELIVVQGQDHPALFAESLTTSTLSWIIGLPPADKFACKAKIRYRQTEQPCNVEIHSESKAIVTFNVPQRAITPGQSVVFYQGETCLGGGIIDFTN